MLAFIEHAGAAPAAPGAYALWLRVKTPLTIAYGARSARLEPGDYLYCGSARGPGGLRARLARHMRREKRAHWHIDALTAVATAVGAFVEPGDDECALNAALAELPMPAPGFGSSDCPNCISHLRYAPPGARLPAAWERAHTAVKVKLCR